MEGISYEERLEKLVLFSLERWMLRGDLIEAYKIMKHMDRLDSQKPFPRVEESVTRAMDLSDRVPLVLTYHPTSIHIKKIIRRHFCHVQRDTTTRHIFPFPSLSAFHRDISFWDTLIHPSFTPNNPPQPHSTFP
eukprot:g19511.t1